MSSTTSDLGQAVRPDGTLKDASEIVWSYDVDESTPFPLDNVPDTHPFFSGGCAPATMVAGARRTARVPRPSQRACDAAEATAEATTSSSLASAGPTARVPRPLQHARDAAEATTEATTSSSLASAGPGAKRKALTAAVPNHRVMRKVDLDDDLADHSDDGATTEPNTEPASDDYESIKAMADADNEATSFRSDKTRGSVDILLIFRYQDDYVHPVTAKVLKGYWCKLCLVQFKDQPNTRTEPLVQFTAGHKLGRDPMMHVTCVIPPWRTPDSTNDNPCQCHANHDTSGRNDGKATTAHPRRQQGEAQQQWHPLAQGSNAAASNAITHKPTSWPATATTTDNNNTADDAADDGGDATTQQMAAANMTMQQAVAAAMRRHSRQRRQCDDAADDGGGQ
ncbi:hypothetical protein EDB89DRAFT_1906827 [Lactarius sanguifluus]|nr:hypothetical protein EDB89DRAFT_1906827 [Lactarius sanguifluus]